jgi:broad specificity phosphatase PhoE
MSILLVRHATAGKRKQWRGDDRLRPLDERGREQAAGLHAALGDYEVKAIYSSPYVRCVQTVEPLATELGLEVQEREELAEGARRTAVLGLATGEDNPGTVVLCTHGDVVNDLLGEETKKGSTSVLELVDGHVVKRGYLPPPA